MLQSNEHYDLPVFDELDFYKKSFEIILCLIFSKNIITYLFNTDDI